MLLSAALRVPGLALHPAAALGSSQPTPTSAFITELLGHYGLRLSFTAFDFFCCQA